MLALAPARVRRGKAVPNRPSTPLRGRVALLQGCVEPILQPEYQAAARRILNRMGFDVVAAPGEQCCGALVHHMGREAGALAAARQNIDAWLRLVDDGGLEAVLVTASGCGTTLKNYGFMLRDDPDYAQKSAQVSALAADISEFIARHALPPLEKRGLRVAYHSACSLQHGQQVTSAPARLLSDAGYDVVTPLESHLCCGSAGVYNILQPDLSGRLGDRKAENLARLKADVIATGNVGCATQIGMRTKTPILHTVELLDWATGGPKPPALAAHS
jgi:glycolate oxidase iron-sulfur subunit